MRVSFARASFHAGATLLEPRRADAGKIKEHVVTRHRYFQTDMVERHSLATNKRADNDAPYSEFLLEIGDGRRPVRQDLSLNSVHLPNDIVTQPGQDMTDLVDWVFGDAASTGLDFAARAAAGTSSFS